MTLHYRDGIAILQLIFFTFALVAAAVLGYRHGMKKASGWYFLAMFSAARFSGGVMWLIASQSNNPTTQKNSITGFVVVTSLGLSPLNLMVLGLLSRANHYVEAPATRIPPKFFRLVELVSLVALIISITGGTSTNFPITSASDISAKTKAALAIFFVVFIVQVAFLVFLFTKRSAIKTGERRILAAVALCTPFLLVRYIYSMRFDYAFDTRFSPLSGSPTIYLILSVLTEIVIVLVACAVGLTLQRTPKEERHWEERPNKNGRRPAQPADEHGMAHHDEENVTPGMRKNNVNHGRGRRGGAGRRPRGPISALIGLAMDARNNRQEQRLPSEELPMNAGPQQTGVRH